MEQNVENSRADNMEDIQKWASVHHADNEGNQLLTAYYLAMKNP